MSRWNAEKAREDNETLMIHLNKAEKTPRGTKRNQIDIQDLKAKIERHQRTIKRQEKLKGNQEDTSKTKRKI